MTLKVRWTRRALRRLDQIGVYIELHMKWPWSRTYSGVEMTSQNDTGRDTRESVVAVAAAAGVALSLWSNFKCITSLVVMWIIFLALPEFTAFFKSTKNLIVARVVWISITSILFGCLIYSFSKPPGEINYYRKYQNQLGSQRENTRTPIVVTFSSGENWSLAIPYISDIRRVPKGDSPSQLINKKCIYNPEKTKISLCGWAVHLDWFGLAGPAAFSPIYVDKNTENNIVVFHMDSAKGRLSIFSNDELADLFYIETIKPNASIATLPIGDYIIKIDVVDRGDPNKIVSQQFEFNWAGGGRFCMAKISKIPCQLGQL